jgi:hypothetical protein
MFVALKKPDDPRFTPLKTKVPRCRRFSEAAVSVALPVNAWLSITTADQPDPENAPTLSSAPMKFRARTNRSAALRVTGLPPSRGATGSDEVVANRTAPKPRTRLLVTVKPEVFRAAPLSLSRR